MTSINSAECISTGTTGDAVRAAMKAAGVSQADLAEELGVSQAAVSRRLAGSVEFSVAELRTAAAVTHTTPAALLADEQPPAVELINTADPQRDEALAESA